MRPTFRNQLRFLAELYKSDADARRKHEQASRPQLNSLEDRTMLSAALHDGDVVALFYDASYSNDAYQSLAGITAGIVAVDHSTGAKAVVYQFPDTDSDGFSDNFQSNGLYGADSYTGGDIAVDGDTIYVALNYGYGVADGKFDFFRIDAATKSGSKVAQYAYRSEELLVAPDGSVINTWSDVSTANNPYGDQIAGVSKLDPATGAETVLYETPTSAAATYSRPVETLIRADGKVFFLSTGFGPTSEEVYRLVAIDPTTGAVTTLANEAKTGEDLAIGPDGAVYASYHDYVFNPNDPYGAAISNGASRYELSAAGGVTATDLGTIPNPQFATSPSQVLVTPGNDVFVAVDRYESTSPYGFGSDPSTHFFKAGAAGFTETSKAPWQATNITTTADGKLLVQWSDSTYTNDPYGPDSSVYELGVSSFDPVTGDEVRLFDVPGTTTNDPYFTSTYPDYTAVASGFAAPPASDPNYLGFNDGYFENNGVYDDRGLVTSFAAGAGKGTVFAEFQAQIWNLTTVSGEDQGPSLGTLANARVNPGSAVERTVTVSDDNTPAADLNVTAVSSSPTVTVAVSGSGATRTLTATLVAGATVGGTVTVTVTDGAGNSTVGTFLVTANAKPTLSAPSNVAVDLGQAPTTLTVTLADDATPTSVLNFTAASSNTALIAPAGIVIAGTGPTRTITITPVAGAVGVSTITLSVADADGASTSTTFTVTVNDPNTTPTMAPLSNVTVVAGSPVPPLAVTVSDLETAAGLLIVTASSSNLALVPAGGLAFTGTGANRTLSITPSLGATGSATITVTVSDGSRSFDRTFVLTINPNAAPVISPIPDTSGRAGTVVTVPMTITDAESLIADLVITAVSSNGTVLPAGGIVVLGTVRNLVLTLPAGVGGTTTITVTARDPQGASATRSFVLNVSPSTGSAVNPFFSVGTDGGTPGTVTFYDADRNPLFVVPAFNNGFTGGIRTATADFDGDGVPDVVVGTGPGAPSAVRILSGRNGTTELFSSNPFEPTFTGGIYVSVGDINNDGKPDLIITPDEGGGPRVDVYSGNGFSKLLSFFGIDDTGFRGGARAALGDMNGDGVEDLLVAAGFGGGPRVAGYDGQALRSTGQLVRMFGDFFVFEQSLRNGVFITVGDITGDGFAELIVGGGPGGGPRVVAFDGKALLNNEYIVRANFFAGNPDNRGGIRLGVKNLDGDALGDLITAAGSGAGTRITGYFGKNISPNGTPPVGFEFDASNDGFVGGVFIG